MAASRAPVRAEPAWLGATTSRRGVHVHDRPGSAAITASIISPLAKRVADLFRAAYDSPDFQTLGVPTWLCVFCGMRAAPQQGETAIPLIPTATTAGKT